MPGAQVAKSSLGGKLATVFNQRRTQKIDLDTGGVGFPGGIDGGVAEITRMEIGTHKAGTQNAGKLYFLMRGVGVAPQEVVGLQDNIIMEPLYDTPTKTKRKTEQEHVDYLISVLQDFGVDTNTVQWADVENGSLFKAILATRPHVRFKTWKPPKATTGQYAGQESRVLVQYGGKGAAVVPNVNGAVVDRTATADDNAAVDDGGYGDNDVEELEAADATGGEVDEVIDLDEMGAAADGGDHATQVRLQELAEEHGVDHNNLPDWAGVAEALKQFIQEEDAPEGTAEEPATEWQKGEVAYYKASPKAKAIEVELTAVFANGKCNAKEIATKKLLKSIPISALSVSEE